jgi:O-antigen/teichoic acid export membrane protein
VVVPPTALTYLGFYALRGRSDFRAWNVLRTLPTVAWMAVLALALSLGSRDPRWLAHAYLIIMLVLLIPLGVTVRARIPGAYVPDLKQFKPMLAYGLPCIASSFPFLVIMRLDQMLIAALLPPSALGLYVVAVAWSSAINPLMNAVGSVLFPKVAGHPAQADRYRAFCRGTRAAASLALILTPVLVAATPWGIILLFGNKFRAAVPAGLILVPAGAVWALNLVIEEGLRGLGNPSAVLYAELAGMVTTALSLYFLLRAMGIVGASIASLAGYSTVMIALLVQARWILGESAATLLLPSSREMSQRIAQIRLLLR